MADAQSPEFDFGDGRHGSFTVSAGETTIQELWSQVRLGSDEPAYDPSDPDQVPALQNLTISNGGTLTVSPFNGNPAAPVDPADGGVLRLKVRGTLTINTGGSISATGRGYRGGTLEGDEPGRIGQQGDSWGNGGTISGAANRGGGGGGFGEVNGMNNPGAGGGGGHRGPGQRGTTGAGSDTSGLGGADFDTVATNLGQAFRDTYPFPRFGSGGGRGGQVENFVNVGALGGRGGGVIIIEAARIVNNGAIVANGGAGGSNLSGGGGGAGGSIWIQSLSPESGTVSVSGGPGGAGSVLGNDGGAGGAGAVLWEGRFSLATATSGQGSVELSPAGGRYDAGEEVTLTAAPDPGWTFVRWEGDLSGSENPEMLEMDGDRSVTAIFRALPTLSASPAIREVGPGASTVSFTVTVTGNTDVVHWNTEITSGENFVTVTDGAAGTNNGVITVSVGNNTQPEAREATLLVTSEDVGSEPVVLTISQSPAVPLLEVIPTRLTASAEGEELVVQVRNGGTGTFDWTAAVLSGTSFASITSGGTGTNSGTFVVSFAVNPTAAQRTAIISVSAEDVVNSPIEIEIVQQAGAPLLQVSPATQLIGSAPTTATLNVSNGGNGTLNWTAAVVGGGAFAAISEGASGVNAGFIAVVLSRNSSTENRVVTVRVESNDADNSPVDVTITQAAQESVLQVTPDIQRVGSSVGSASFQVQNAGTGAMSWTAAVVEGANFISITGGAAGTNDGVVTVSVGENTGTAERTGVIEIQAPGAAGNPQRVTLVQSPRTPVLRVVPAEQSVGSAGGPVSITIENGGAGALNWTASVVTGANFLTFASAASGAGDGVLQLNVGANATEEARSGTIRIEAPGAEDSPQIATIIQLGCEILARPRNLSASDGLFPNSVELIWSAAPGATEYEIFRSSSGNPGLADLLGTSTVPRFSDTLAKPPEYELVNRGCFNPGEFIITNNIYFYYVTAVNACGTSEFSQVATGYRGLPAPPNDTDPGEFEEPALPNEKSVGGANLLAGETSVALRLSALEPIDPDSLWAELAGGAVSAEALSWVPVSGDNTDGWIVIALSGEVAGGGQFDALAGGATLAGEVLAPAGATFLPGGVAKAAPEAGGPVAVPYLPPGEDSGLFLEGVGAVHEVLPRAVYAEAQLVWIPVPEGRDAHDLALYYQGDGGEYVAWYPGENVIGWLDSPMLEVSEDGAYVGAWVNHGGTVRLGIRPAAAAPPASIAPGNLGALATVLLTGLILLGSGRRRRSPVPIKIR